MACCEFFNQRIITAPGLTKEVHKGSSWAKDPSFSVKLKRKENESLGIVTTFLPEGDGLVIDWVSKDGTRIYNIYIYMRWLHDQERNTTVGRHNAYSYDEKLFASQAIVAPWRRIIKACSAVGCQWP